MRAPGPPPRSWYGAALAACAVSMWLAVAALASRPAAIPALVLTGLAAWALTRQPAPPTSSPVTELGCGIHCVYCCHCTTCTARLR